MPGDRGRGGGARGRTAAAARPIRRVAFSGEALGHIAALRQHYRDKQRPEAMRNLADAIRTATRQIGAGKGLPAPRSYPELAREGRAWVKAGRYWIVYSLTRPPVILAVFYDQADIPGRYAAADEPDEAG